MAVGRTKCQRHRKSYSPWSCLAKDLSRLLNTMMSTMIKHPNGHVARHLTIKYCGLSRIKYYVDRRISKRDIGFHRQHSGAYPQKLQAQRQHIIWQQQVYAQHCNFVVARGKGCHYCICQHSLHAVRRLLCLLCAH